MDASHEPPPDRALSAPLRGLRALRSAASELVQRDFFHWGAALAFYSIFSLTPLLLLGLTALGSVVGEAAVQARLVEQAGVWLGPSARDTVAQVVGEVGTLRFDTWMVIPTSLMLLLGATAIFANVQAALNDIWRLRPHSGAVRNVLRTRLMSALMLVVLGGTLALSVLLTLAAQIALPYVPDAVADTLRLGSIIEAAVTLVTLWVLLVLTFMILPDAEIGWQEVWVGAGVTALLLYLGGGMLRLYVTMVDLGSAFGAAGSVFTLLVWIYYSSQMFFLGAIFTRVWADQTGTPVRPERYATFVETRPVSEPGVQEPDGSES